MCSPYRINTIRFDPVIKDRPDDPAANYLLNP